MNSREDLKDTVKGLQAKTVGFTFKNDLDKRKHKRNHRPSTLTPACTPNKGHTRTTVHSDIPGLHGGYSFFFFCKVNPTLEVCVACGISVKMRLGGFSVPAAIPPERSTQGNCPRRFGVRALGLVILRNHHGRRFQIWSYMYSLNTFGHGPLLLQFAKHVLRREEALAVESLLSITGETVIRYISAQGQKLSLVFPYLTGCS